MERAILEGGGAYTNEAVENGKTTNSAEHVLRGRESSQMGTPWVGARRKKLSKDEWSRKEVGSHRERPYWKCGRKQETKHLPKNFFKNLH